MRERERERERLTPSCSRTLMPLILALAGVSTNKVTNSRLLASMACDNKVFPMRSCKSYRIGSIALNEIKTYSEDRILAYLKPGIYSPTFFCLYNTSDRFYILT